MHVRGFTCPIFGLFVGKSLNHLWSLANSITHLRAPKGIKINLDLDLDADVDNVSVTCTLSCTHQIWNKLFKNASGKEVNILSMFGATDTSVLDTFCWRSFDNHCGGRFFPRQQGKDLIGRSPVLRVTFHKNGLSDFFWILIPENCLIDSSEQQYVDYRILTITINVGRIAFGKITSIQLQNYLLKINLCMHVFTLVHGSACQLCWKLHRHFFLYRNREV